MSIDTRILIAALVLMVMALAAVLWVGTSDDWYEDVGFEPESTETLEEKS